MFNGDKTASEQKGTEERSEHALVTAGQRSISLLWECTQAFIAVSLVGATIVASLHQVFYGKSDVKLPEVLLVLVGTVVGAYFNRTNSHKIGGVGDKTTDNQPYVGR